MVIALLALVMIWTLSPASGQYNISEQIATITSTVDQLWTKHNGIENKIDVLNEHIYFKATFYQIDPTIRPGTVVFNKELNNTGCSYNPNTGIFTTPRSGVYIFAVQKFLRGRGDASWDLYINDRMELRSRSINNDDTSNAFVYLVFLHTGDQVSVSNGGDLNIYGENHSFFAGWLLRGTVLS